MLSYFSSNGMIRFWMETSLLWILSGISGLSGRWNLLISTIHQFLYVLIPCLFPISLICFKFWHNRPFHCMSLNYLNLLQIGQWPLSYLFFFRETVDANDHQIPTTDMRRNLHKDCLPKCKIKVEYSVWREKP